MEMAYAPFPKFYTYLSFLLDQRKLKMLSIAQGMDLLWAL